MRIGRGWTRLSYVVAALVAWASALGVFAEAYAQEAVPWAAQGAGQDAANLIVAVPLLAISGWFAARGSSAAAFAWLGTLVYIVYSYLFYACFVHFGPWFPLYVAVLGTAFYTLVGALSGVNPGQLADEYGPGVRVAEAAIVLLLGGVLFALLELAEIASAIRAGGAPASVTDLGLTVNPVHVFDLAFILPGAIVTALLVRRRHPIGLLFAVPLLVFFALMGIAVSAMILMMRARGLPAGPGVLALFATMIVASLYASYRFVAAPGVTSRSATA